MKETTHISSFKNRVSAFYDHHQKLIGAAANGLSIVTGLFWCAAFIPDAPGWVWPAVATLAACAVALLSYRCAQLSNRAVQYKEAFDTLFKANWRTHVETLQEVLANAQSGGDLPVARFTAALMDMKALCKSPEEIDALVDLVSQYEELRLKR